MPDTITAKRSFRSGSVQVNIEIAAHGYHPGTVRLKASTVLTTNAARQLAADLIAHADREDAATKKKTDRERRRKEWRDREIAAGRMEVTQMGELLGKRR